MAVKPQPNRTKANRKSSVKKANHPAGTPEGESKHANVDFAGIHDEQTALARAETQSRRLASLNLVAQAVSSTRNLNEILEIAAREIVSQLDAYSCGVALISADRTELKVVAFAGPEEEPSTVGVTIQVDGNLAAQTAFATHQSMVITAEENPRIQNAKADQIFKARGIASMLITPVIARDEVIGTFGTDTKDPARVFTPEDMELAVTIASQISGAVENARLFEETQHLLKEAQAKKEITETLLAITQVLSKTLSLQDVFDVILRELQRVVPYDSSSVQIVQKDRLVIVAGRGFENFEFLSGVSFDLDDEVNPGVQVLRAKRPRILSDVSRHPSFTDPLHGGGKIRGWIGAPLLFGDRAIGIFTLDKYEPDFYNDEYAELVMAFAAQAATAIENARLFDETQHLLRETEQRATELAILNDVGKAMARTLDVRTLTRDIGDILHDVFEAEIADILLYDQDTNMVRLAYSFNSASFEEEPPWRLEEGGLTTQVIVSGQPLLLNSAQEIERHGAAAYLTTPTDDPDPQSFLGVPILAGHRVLGVVDVESYRPHAFNEGNVRLLQTICSNMGVALENARLFDETQRLLEETRKAKEIAETLRSASLAFTESLKLDTILEKLLDYLALMIPYDSATIFLMEDDTHLVARAIRGYERFMDVSLAQRMRIDLENTPPVHRIVVEQSSAVIMDTGQDPTWTWRQTTKHIRSWMGIPLVASGRTIGMYSLDKTEPNFFTGEHLHFAEALAAQAAIVIEKSQLFDSEVVSRARAETQSHRLASLNLVAQTVSSTRNLNEIFEIAAREIVSELHARSCGVTLMNAERTQLEVVAFAGQEGVPSTVGIVIPLEGNVGTQRVITTRQSLVLTADENFRMQSKRAHEVFQARGTTCLLITPMLVRDEAIGTFGTDTDDPGRVFSSEDVELAFTIASQISGAIENARLFEETQRLLKITEERAAELSVISKVSQALILESELDNTIQLIGSQISEIFNADIVYVALIDPQTKLIYFPYQVGEEFTVLKYGEGLVSKIIETGEPLLINKNVGERALEIGARPVGREVLSYLGVPIKTSQSTIGIISVQSTTQEGIFNEDSLRLLTTIAANAGAALHNARLFSDALEHLRQVEILTNSARAIETNVYEPAMLESVAAREDALGELARVFRKMADEVRLREQRLKRQLAQLQLDIEEKELAKNETVALYLPMDRRQALATGKTLPAYVHGTALFADVSGFTALTDSLINELGLQRGAEEMTRHLNRVLSTLIHEVHRYGGSVISFGGDAITCWFDDLDLDGNAWADTSVERAVASALAMQKGMAQFSAIITPHGKPIAITIKIALTTGPARRMLVGDRALHQLDVVAGSTLMALEDIEHEAQRGEIIIAGADLRRLVEKFYLTRWHLHGEKRYAVITGLKRDIAPSPWPELAKNAIPEFQIRPWLHPIVFEKIRAGRSDLLSELRPATALFFKFDGLDYDNDPNAGIKLDLFIQWAAWVITFHGGAIIQFTVDDKGSYIYAAFGAPIAHKDDAARAVSTALELASPPNAFTYMTNLCIGIASGLMRVGAYGGSAHRNYGALGDRTNLAARLMMAASRSSIELPEGQHAVVFCNESIYAAVNALIEFEPMPPIRVKGKSELISVYRPLRKREGNNSDRDTILERAQLIDSLSPTDQLILKVASVIGQEFTLDTLSAIYPEVHTREQLQSHLQTLIDSGLIARRSLESSEYAFTDIQTREAAYNLMLFAQRRQLHRLMAELLEQPSSGKPPYAEIAYHWKAADEFPKAIQYLEKAGEHAHQMGDFEAATRFFNESLGLNSGS